MIRAITLDGAKEKRPIFDQKKDQFLITKILIFLGAPILFSLTVIVKKSNQFSIMDIDGNSLRDTFQAVDVELHPHGIAPTF